MGMKIIYGILACILLFGCKKEDELSPSKSDRDYFVVEDNPNDALDHLRYQIYSELGLPIFYNDTLASEERYDAGGNPYTYYEVIDIGYGISSYNSAASYALADNREDVQAMIELMQKYLLNLLPKEQYPFSYLLVDSLYLTHGGAQDALLTNCYKSMKTTVIGNIERVRSWDDNKKRKVMSEIAAMELVEDVVNNTLLNEELFEAFDTIVTKTVYKATDVAFRPLRVNNYGGKPQGSISYPKPAPEMFGLLDWRAEPTPTHVFVPTKEQDYASYIGLILINSDQDIRERYRDYPLVVHKYETMLEMMENSDILKYRQINNN